MVISYSRLIGFGIGMNFDDIQIHVAAFIDNFTTLNDVIAYRPCTAIQNEIVANDY